MQRMETHYASIAPLNRLLLIIRTSLKPLLYSPLPLTTYQHKRKTRETSSVEPGCTTTSGTEGIL